MFQNFLTVVYIPNQTHDLGMATAVLSRLSYKNRNTLDQI